MGGLSTRAHSAMQSRDVRVAYPNDRCHVRCAMAGMAPEEVFRLTYKARQPTISVILSEHAFGAVLDSRDVEAMTDSPDVEAPETVSAS